MTLGNEDEFTMHNALDGVMGEYQPARSFVSCQRILQFRGDERQFTATKCLNLHNVIVVANHMVAKLCRIRTDDKPSIV
jgi:hypothetical protein